jgi:hypothetical protein
MSTFHQLSEGKSGSGAGREPLRTTCAHTAVAATAHKPAPRARKRETGRDMDRVNLVQSRPERV